MKCLCCPLTVTVSGVSEGCGDWQPLLCEVLGVVQVCSWIRLAARCAIIPRVIFCSGNRSNLEKI